MAADCSSGQNWQPDHCFHGSHRCFYNALICILLKGICLYILKLDDFLSERLETVAYLRYYK